MINVTQISSIENIAPSASFSTSGLDISNFYTKDNPSGFITESFLNNAAVILTGDQIVSGTKTFADGVEIGTGSLTYFEIDESGFASFSNRPTVNGTGVLLESDGYATETYVQSLQANTVDTFSDQLVSGVKSFLEPPIFVEGIEIGSGDPPDFLLDSSGFAFFSNRPTVNGSGVLLEGDIDVTDLIYTTGDQTKSGLLSLSLSNDEIRFDLGFSMMAYVRNVEPTDLNKGEVVYVSGAQGDRAAVARASNTSELTAATTFGVVNHIIPAGGDGYIISHGQLKNTNLLTAPFLNGDQVYLGSTPGTITNVKPVAPNHAVLIGFVEKISAGNNGILYVKIQNGYEIDELHDVKITNVQSNEFLVREAGNQYWINSGIAPGDIGAIANEPTDTTPVQTVRALTQVEYDAITPDPNTLYFII